MTSSPAPDFEESEYQPHDRSAPALKPGEGASKHAPALPMRGEVFDGALDENGQVGDSGAPKRAGAWFFAGLAALFCAYNLGSYVGQKGKSPAPLAAFATQKEKLPPLRIQIAGRVKKPGVYTLPGGARIEDALKIAGGAAPQADLNGLNLADWAVDGSKIEVPARQAVKIARIEPTPTPVVIIREVFITPPQNAPGEALAQAPDAPVSPPETPRNASPIIKPGDSSAPSKTEARPLDRAKKAGKSAPAALALLRKNPVDLNKAGAEQLAALPGVGPKMAERIIAYRRENGGFKTVSDLDNVKGIGEKRMETLKDLVKVN